MTETTKTVFEKYQIRKTKKQKTAFIEYIKEISAEGGYDCHVERGMLGARNIVVGDPEKAKVIYTAHYDTCPRLPFPNFITPKSFIIYLLYQIAVVALFFFVPMFLIGVIMGVAASLLNVYDEFFDLLSLIYYLIAVCLLVLIMAGPANKHTANDNTSGVTTLLDIMRGMPEESRSAAAFIFFDLEELGLFGSAGYASKHKKALKNSLLLNFDCVSDGKNILFALKRKAKKFAPELQEAFEGNESLNVEILSKGVFYPSDQANFPCGVGVASLKRSKLFGVLYMNRIHTHRDVIYREENIEFLVRGSIKLAERLNDKNK